MPRSRRPRSCPSARKAALKGLTARRGRVDRRAKIVLGNTYHLWLRPGPRRGPRARAASAASPAGRTRCSPTRAAFRRFSLGGNSPAPPPRRPESPPVLQKSLVTVDEEGFTFRSHLDGNEAPPLAPRSRVRVQGQASEPTSRCKLDICPPGAFPSAPSSRPAISRTTRWASPARSRPTGPRVRRSSGSSRGADLRRSPARPTPRSSARARARLSTASRFGGFLRRRADPEDVRDGCTRSPPALDPGAPRAYLMGVGTPQESPRGHRLAAVEHVSTACSRRVNARNGQALTPLRQGRHQAGPPTRTTSCQWIPDCACACLRRAATHEGYLRHLFPRPAR